MKNEIKKNDMWLFIKKNMSGVAGKIIIGLILIVIIIFGIKDGFRNKVKPVKLKLEDIGELATQVAYVTEVDEIDDPRKFFNVDIPFTKSHYVYSYDFVIKGGFKVEDIVPKVNEKTKKVTINLPKPEILSAELKQDSLKIYLEDESIFNQVTMKESNKALQELTEEAKKTAEENGLLEGAKENVKNVLTGLFKEQFPIKEYTYIFEFDGEDK